MEKTINKITKLLDLQEKRITDIVKTIVYKQERDRQQYLSEINSLKQYFNNFSTNVQYYLQAIIRTCAKQLNVDVNFFIKDINKNFEIIVKEMKKYKKEEKNGNNKKRN
jgi:hypothetical protein